MDLCLKKSNTKNMRKNVFAFTEMIPNIFDTCVIKSRKVKKELCTKEKVHTMIYKTLQRKHYTRHTLYIVFFIIIQVYYTHKFIFE